MKKAYLFFFAITSLFIVAGCNNNQEDKQPTLSVAEEEAEITVGNTSEIVPTVGNTEDDLEVLYVSSNSEVAGVEGGLITAKKTGTATITVSLKDFPNVKVTVSVTVLPKELVLSGVDTLMIGQSHQFIGTDENGGTSLFWDSSNSTIASVSDSGLVTALRKGSVTISITSLNTGATKQMELIITQPEPETVEISGAGGTIKIRNSYKLYHIVSPSGASQEVEWSSSDETIATVDQQGNVMTHRSGTVDIIAKCKDSEIEGKITLTVIVDPIDLLKSFNVANPVAKMVNTYGNSVKQEPVFGSVSMYWPGSLNLKVNIIPITPTIDGVANPYIGQVITPEMRTAAEFKTVRSGILKTDISNIIYHDTGNNNIGANASMHASYIVSSENFNDYKARSWHYTVDESEAIQHLPDNELAWQGDTYEAYSTTIGIETCVNQGSNLYTTWHRTAKLMASLLKKYDLSLSNIRQHWDYSQKECPQTLRKSNLYQNAVALIEAEYLVLTELEGYTITFTSHDPSYIDNTGRILKLDQFPRKVNYTVTITNDSGYNQSIQLSSTLPADFR